MFLFSIFHSQDDAVVNVVMLRGIRIYAPLTRLQTGTKMSVYAMGVTDHETPFTFGNAVPPLTFTWMANSKDVLHLQSVYKNSNILQSAENNFAQQVVSKTTGQATLKLEVRAKAGSRLQLTSGNVLYDEEQIQVT